MPVLNLTKRAIDCAKFDPAGPRFLFDQTLQGFGPKLSPPSARWPDGVRTYFVQYRLGKGRRATKVRQFIGCHGSPWTPDSARVPPGPGADFAGFRLCQISWIPCRMPDAAIQRWASDGVPEGGSHRYHRRGFARGKASVLRVRPCCSHGKLDLGPIWAAAKSLVR